MKLSIRWILLGTALILGGLISQYDVLLAQVQELNLTNLDSWAWVGTPADQTASSTGSNADSGVGFMHLNCQSLAGTCNSEGQPNVEVDFPNADVTGWGWLGTGAGIELAADDTSIGWVDFDPAPLPDDSIFADSACPVGSKYPDEPCTDAVVSGAEEGAEITGWARIPSIACEGARVLNGITSCDYTDPDHINNNWGWVQLSGVTDAGSGDTEFGVVYREGALEGWAWSGGGSLSVNTVPDPDEPAAQESSTGLGWIDFTGAAVPGTGSSQPGYFATEYGDVYFGDDVTNPVDATEPNASFLVLENGSINVENFDRDSSFDNSDITQTDPLTLPDSSGRSSLGNLDQTALTTVVSDGKNANGSTVRTFRASDVTTQLQGNQFLNGEVWIFDGSSSYTLGGTTDRLTFTNGTSAIPTGNFNGSGVIIVNGDLRVESNIFYDTVSSSGELQHIRNLASVVWIVNGDLTIAPNVQQVSGSFLVLDDGATPPDGGLFTTEDGERTPFVLQGLVVARTFSLNRHLPENSSAGQSAQASERFVYDGRILVNPPIGLTDFGSTLPIFE